MHTHTLYKHDGNIEHNEHVQLAVMDGPSVTVAAVGMALLLVHSAHATSADVSTTLRTFRHNNK